MFVIRYTAQGYARFLWGSIYVSLNQILHIRLMNCYRWCNEEWLNWKTYSYDTYQTSELAQPGRKLENQSNIISMKIFSLLRRYVYYGWNLITGLIHLGKNLKIWLMLPQHRNDMENQYTDYVINHDFYKGLWSRLWAYWLVMGFIQWTTLCFFNNITFANGHWAKYTRIEQRKALIIGMTV